MCSSQDGTLHDSDYPLDVDLDVEAAPTESTATGAGNSESQGPEQMVAQAACRVKQEPASWQQQVGHVMEDLTDAAVTSRLNRLFAPRANGTYKVPDAIVKKWKTNEGKAEIIREFRKQGYDKDGV